MARTSIFKFGFFTIVAFSLGACQTLENAKLPSFKKTPGSSTQAGKPRQVKKILFLGDSLSMGAFGRALDSRLRKAGFEVYTAVAGGGTPYYWLREHPPVSLNIGYWEKSDSHERRLKSISRVPKVEPLLAKFDPDLVIIQTGTNLYAPLRTKKRSKAANVREIRRLVNLMARRTSSAGRRSYWVTPPDASEKKYPRSLQNEMLGIMKEETGDNGRVFNSYAVTSYTKPYPAYDGIHLDDGQYRRWANKVAADVIRYAKGAP